MDWIRSLAECSLTRQGNLGYIVVEVTLALLFVMTFSGAAKMVAGLRFEIVSSQTSAS